MEIALYTGPDRINQVDAKGSRFRELNGSIVVCHTAKCIRQKWVEIVADLCRPERRGGAYPFKFAKSVQAVWKPEWLQTSIAMERGEISPADAWATMSKDLPDLGKDPRGEVPRSETWMWSARERKQFCICRLDCEDHTLAAHGYYVLDGKVHNGPLKRIDYRGVWGVGDTQDIEDPEVIVHPKLKESFSANQVESVVPDGTR